MIKKLVKSILTHSGAPGRVAYDRLRRYRRIPLSTRCVNFVFQRILRQNASAPFSVHFTSRVADPQRLEIGDGVDFFLAFSGGCYFQATNGISIGDGTLIAPGVKIISANHDLHDLARHEPCQL